MVFSATKTSDGVVLRIHAQGEILVSRVTEYLNALEYAYNSAYVFEKLAEVAEQESVRPSISQRFVAPDSTVLKTAWLNAAPEKIAALVPKADRLQLKGVVLQSPGFWDFLGSINPLNFILEYLKLSHEQSKDREYRNREEARKLWLENEILRTEMIERKMNLLRQAGRTDYELQILAEQLLINPVHQLGEFQVRGEIGSAEMISIEESSVPVPPISKEQLQSNLVEVIGPIANLLVDEPMTEKLEDLSLSELLRYRDACVSKIDELKSAPFESSIIQETLLKSLYELKELLEYRILKSQQSGG